MNSKYKIILYCFRSNNSIFYKILIYNNNFYEKETKLKKKIFVIDKKNSIKYATKCKLVKKQIENIYILKLRHTSRLNKYIFNSQLYT